MLIPTAAPQRATREPQQLHGHGSPTAAGANAQPTAAMAWVVNRWRFGGGRQVPEPEGARHACAACGAHVRSQQSCGVCGLLCLPFTGAGIEQCSSVS